MTTTSNYDIASMTAHKRASIRQELTEHWDHTTQIGVEEHATSNVMVAQFIETAINGLDAVDRVDALAQKLLTEGGPINTAVATEIINALRGIYMTTTTFYATRDSATARDDEDRAMAHVSIGDFADLEDAQAALRAHMIEEVQWLIGKHVSATSLRRAADILEAAEQQTCTLAPDTDKSWARATIEAAGLTFAITRSVREN